MTLANRITIFRILLIPVFMAFLLADTPPASVIGAIIFIIAACSDILDGYLARKQEEVTILGKFLDPLADKLLITAALISLVALNLLNPWIVLIIISREIAVTGLRLILASEGIVLAASNLGKTKTVFQVIAVVAIIIESIMTTDWFRNSLFSFLYSFYPAALMSFITVAVALILTLWSGLDYFLKNKHAIKN
ncbi:MAG TPA: CDP-diacylglycerol--glycerol-3-phosphate 3-phosphatidyltransferase [Firmicutes bacterium]|nr:CDP-diacylglycerol--glycerol-3-phosphate 3-phosphatidyltransferase [Bacillota bacterium]